jgi:LDH2 family malate/lactate/ureidoglycolate dehydrogenase
MPEKGLGSGIFSAEHLRQFTNRVFEYFNVPQQDALLAADVQAYSDEHGMDPDGIAGLKTSFDLLKARRITLPLPAHYPKEAAAWNAFAGK